MRLINSSGTTLTLLRSTFFEIKSGKKHNFQKCFRSQKMKMENPAWRFNGNERKYLEEVLATGFRAGADGAFTMRLENFFAAVYNVKYGITFNSGTTTLHSVLLAMGVLRVTKCLRQRLRLLCVVSLHIIQGRPQFMSTLFRILFLWIQRI